MKETFSKHWDELENKYEFFNRLYELLNNDSHFINIDTCINKNMFHALHYGN